MLEPPGGGTPYDYVDPGTANPDLAAASVAFAQVNDFINGGLNSGFEELFQARVNGNAYFFPQANI